MSTLPSEPGDEQLSMADRAFQQLQDRLIFLDIPPGAPINESRLSEELHLGRTPLREAVKRLESEHLVVTFPRRGTFSTAVDITALSEISQVREVLEPLAARLAAEHTSDRSRDPIERLARELGAVGHEEFTWNRALRWDIRIHREIYMAAGNAHLQATAERYGNLATRIWCVVADRIGDPGQHVEVHSTLLSAILEGDGERAGSIMLRHVQDFEEQIRKVL
jgi:DNA-binding GntR family transcriptional regulator